MKKKDYDHFAADLDKDAGLTDAINSVVTPALYRLPGAGRLNDGVQALD